MNASTITIRCVNNNSIHQVEPGLSLSQIAKKLNIKLDNDILGALVNNKTTGLSYRVFQPKTIQFIDIKHPEGMRMYIRSLIFMLYSATTKLFPDRKLKVSHSVSKGLYCELNGTEEQLSIADVLKIGAYMKSIAEENRHIERSEIETDKAIEIFDKLGQHNKSRLLRQRGQMYTTTYQLIGQTGLFYGPLVESTGLVRVFDLNKYYKGMLLQIPRQNNPLEVEELVIQNQMFSIFREFAEWSSLLNVTTLADLNDLTSSKRADTLIQVAEALHEKKIGQIADMIAERKDKVKIVLISGPSSSGKTTSGKRIAIQLLVAGIVPINLSLDNYFVDREHTPRDENGEYDFEALEALDIELFNSNLLDLLSGKKIEIPKFSFDTGKRYYDGETLQFSQNQIIIIEGIHALNPKLTHLIDPESKFKIYVSALAGINFDDHTRINTTDNRLIRRIVRDYKYRNYSAAETILRWPSVRRGEDTHIFPYQEEADVMFNSALLYELAVLKPFAEPILLEVTPNSEAYTQARRLLGFLSYFKPLHSDTIPPTSIMREFLGGSSFVY